MARGPDPARQAKSSGPETSYLSIKEYSPPCRLILDFDEFQQSMRQ